MTSNARKIGLLAERVAAGYLEKKGFEIVASNWTCRWGEIDLITKKDGLLIFVEVKYRSGDRYGKGFEAVGYFKRRSLKRAISYYLLSHGAGTEWRFDVISLERSKRGVKVLHLECFPLE